MPEPGVFLTLEGIDGCGKSTQAKRLEAVLKTDHDVLRTREPGGSVGAEDIRRLLVEGDPDRWSPETEILLFTAARRDHLEKVILPAIEAGKIVISDRFADSTRVYQGAARADLRQLVDQLHDLVIEREPDLTLILDMAPEKALTRGLARNSGEDRFEDMGLDFQRRLQIGFHALATAFPERCRLINADQSEDAVAEDILTAVREHLE